jgi:hypothetical protein
MYTFGLAPFLLLMPMIHKFGVLMESLNSCIFLLQLLSLLSKNSSGFFSL